MGRKGAWSVHTDKPMIAARNLHAYTKDTEQTRLGKNFNVWSALSCTRCRSCISYSQFLIPKFCSATLEVLQKLAYEDNARQGRERLSLLQDQSKQASNRKKSPV